MILQEAITTHLFAIYILIGIMFFNLFSVLNVKEFIKLAKRLKFLTPIYHLSNAFVIYTGAIVSAYNKDLSLTVILMIITSIFIMVLEIKRYKKQRVIKLNDTQLQAQFVLFAKKIYMIEISAVIFTYIISKVF